MLILFPTANPRRAQTLSKCRGEGKIKEVQTTVAVAADGSDTAVIRRDQLKKKDVGPILEENARNGNTLPTAAPRVRVLCPMTVPLIKG
jgi:hypothetical protein